MITINKNIKTIPVRQLLSIPKEEILLGLKTHMYVLFEDGKKEFMTYHEVILMRYLMEVHLLVLEMPITSVYVVSKYYSHGIYVSSTINKCYEALYEEIVNVIMKPYNRYDLKDPVNKAMFEAVNTIFNEVVYTNLNYVTSLNIDDFLDIQMDEELLESLREVERHKTLEAVKFSHDTLDRVIRTKIDTSKNIIARSYIAGTVNPDQVKQMLAARGFLTEIDSSIFKYPIPSSYTLGLDNIYDLTIESRSGAKALFVSNKAIQETEYFARELQLVVMGVEKLVHGDCGNRDYMSYLVRDASVTGKSDLPNIIGKRYVNPETGLEEVITKNHTHLENTVIKMRSVLHCKHQNKNTICSSCFGELSFSVFDHTNIGHISSTTPTQKMSQGILSTKHLTSSATSTDIVLDETAKKFFSVKNKDGYALRANVLGKSKSSLYITIPQYQAFGLKDLTSETNIYKLNPAWVSRISSFTLSIVHESGKVEPYLINVKSGSRYGNFTYEFLKHVKDFGFTLDDNDNYVISLESYTSTEPILTLPQIEFNFLALSKSVKAEFKYLKFVKGKYSVESQESLLSKLFDLINSKLNINIALLEVMVYAFSIMSIEKKNFDFGRNSDDVQLARIYDIMTNRSLGGGYAWEKVNQIILSPKSFDGRNNVDHLLDGLLKPAETMRDYYGIK